MNVDVVDFLDFNGEDVAILVERKYVSVLTKQDNGTYKYESVKKEVPLSEKPLSVGQGGARWTVPSDKPGDFALLVRDEHDIDLHRIEFTVAGDANISRSLEKNAELQLSLKKKDIGPGDEIEMQIKAPYVGAGLITVERDRVYAHKWFKTDTTASIQTIKLPDDFEGSGYVSVAFIRDIGSNEVFMSPLSYGVVPFSVILGAMIFLVMLAEAFLRKRKAAANPWGEGATTLEWTLSSPPPFHQFNELPRIKPAEHH